MEIAAEIKDFLTTRRARITPDAVGLPTTSRRRVPGLRREEVALLAGVSAEYYVQIERGRVAGVSDEVLLAIVRALRLDDVETEHFLTLARSAAATPLRRPRSQGAVSPSLQALLDAMVTAPAVVMTPALDIVAGNALGMALYEPVNGPVGQGNSARFLFIAPDADSVFPDWNTAADDAVAMLRGAVAADPHGKTLTSLVGELASRSAEFRVRWAAHQVVAHRRGAKTFRHPAVGEFAVQYEALAVTGSNDLTLFGYTAEPASPAEQALRLLSTLVADRPTATVDNY